MKASIILLAVIGLTHAQVEPYDGQICRLLKDGTKIRKPGTCGSFLTCENGVGKQGDCNKGKNIYFNKESGTCVAKIPDEYCKDPCNNKSPFWEADRKSCNGYFKCVNGVGTEEKCPNDLHFDMKKQACVYKSESSCKGYNYCDVIPNNVPFKNEKSCEKFFECNRGSLKEYFCENKTYYHEQKGCTKKSQVECENHPIPLGICGTAKRPIRNKFVNDERTCPGYYFCTDKGDNVPDLEPTYGICPEGKFFDFNIQGCFTASGVLCEEDRCEGMNRSKVISPKKGCQHYLICDKNKTVKEEQCPDGLYFNDTSMKCTSEIVSYKVCS